MKLGVLIFLCGSAAALAEPGTLRWTNGETMPGDMVEATGTSATWKTPLFEEPVVLDWNVIRRVDWPVKSKAPGDPFVICLRDGSALYGDLAAITGSSIFIHASRYGDVELARAQVLSARRVKGGSLILAGPTGDAGWQETEVQQGVPIRAQNVAKGKKDGTPGFTAGPGGTLQMPYWNRATLLGLQATGALDVEFRVHASGRPGFQLSIDVGAGTALRIETWDDALVAALPNESDFKLIRKIDDSERDIALRYCWDPKARHCMIFTPSGELIAEWQPPADNSPSVPGLLLQNKGRDLSLDYLRIRKWDGTSLPPKVDASRARVEFADGRILAGEVTSGSAGSIQLSGSGAQDFALKDVDGLFFSADAATGGAAKDTLSYEDGTYLKGKIAAMKDGKVTLETSFSVQPIVASMDGARQLMIQAPDAGAAPLSSALDSLRIGQSSFHGMFVTAGLDSPQWIPVGGAAPVTPARTMPYEIDRAFPPDAQPQEVPALFYTRTGDVLPGNMHGLNRNGVEFDSVITQATTLPAAILEAIQFDASAGRTLHGFADPGWRILKGDEAKVRRSGDSIEMDPGSAIGNAAAMQSSEIRFGMNLQGGFWAVRLRMFCAGTNPAKSTNLIFACNGNEVNCGLEGMDGQFDEPRIEATTPSGKVSVRLAVQAKGVDLYLNGMSVATIPVPPESRQGAGLIIEPAGLWGNSSGAIKLGGFSMRSPPGCTWLPDVAADAKVQALTIPRFQRDDPPTHALIAANGDILRGEIEAATNANFGFRSGMEELTVPRDRVKAVVWLGKPMEAPSGDATPSPGQALLAERLEQRIMFGEMRLRTFTSYLQSQNPKLKFKLPDDSGSRSYPLPIGGESVASALDKICALYGMTYRVDDKGVIVIEPGGGNQPEGMVDKIYWLKPDSLPAKDPADKVIAALKAMGVAFPAGATAVWNADTAQLSVHNTAENQANVAQAISPYYAGAAGSPTHWLVLASGARLALAVDKFGKDAVTGWHPIYGRCTIPTAQIALIRTSPIDPSAAMKSMGNWQTVYAPEPVLPDAGGDSTALIGKPAADFKLALLGGGDFQLAREKGKIVVLDFWATWCGPCVRSLPGLIQSMAPFPANRVRFVGIDQDEPASQVKQFLETRGWKLNVGLDDGDRVGKQYGADAIPETVIIGADGKVAWVKSGYTPDGEGEAAAEVNKLLAAPAGQ